MSDGRANALPCPPLATPMTYASLSREAGMQLIDRNK